MARRTIADGLSGYERALLTLAFLGLAAPLMPIPGDHPARITVHFRHAGMTAPRRFAARTEASICAIMRTSLSFADPAEDSFTQVDCGLP
jgi:hypothetical protein